MKAKPMNVLLDRYRARQPFYAFSGRNKKGHKPVPLIFARRERILQMYWGHASIEEIAAALNLSIDAVRDHIKSARKAGDPRAARTTGEKRIMQAKARRNQILMLHGHGYSPREIADICNCHLRLVQMRLREAGE